MRAQRSLTEIAVVATTGVVLSLLLWNLAVTEYGNWAGQRDGDADARADVAAGVLKVQIGGKPQPWTPIFASLCKSRYGVTVERRYHCVPSEYQVSYLNAYNDVMVPHITKKVGGFSMTKLLDEAHDKWARRVELAEK